MRLGWRWPRPNDFQTPDKRPLKDTFGSLQQFMNWPWDWATISGAVGVAFTVMTLTPKTATYGASPHNLIRGNSFQVPPGYDSYLAVGVLGVGFVGAAAAGTYSAIWRLNSANQFSQTEEKSTAGGTIRLSTPLLIPCRAGDTFDIQTGSSGGATTLAGTVAQQAFMAFLPFT